MQNKNIAYLLTTIIILLIIIGSIGLFLVARREVLVEIPTNRSGVNTRAIPVVTEEKNTIVNEVVDIGKSNEEMYFKSNTPLGNEVSNVVGYFANGAFITYVPQWMVENWRSDSFDSGNTTVFSPEVPSSVKKDFSDIVIKTQTTDETFNAEWLYENSKNGALVSEIILNAEGDMRIYHIEKQNGVNIEETFYIDGDKKTGIFTFSASKENYYRYNVRVKEFIQGLRRGGTPRG